MKLTVCERTNAEVSNMTQSYDCLVIGAGFAGAVAARELAERGGKRVLVLERRNHIAGNAYDLPDEAGVVIHQYGPHIFHTRDRRVYDYLSRFTRWRDYQHRVVANVHGVEMPVPFNLTSLELAFGKEKAQRLEESSSPSTARRRRSPFWTCAGTRTRRSPLWPTMCTKTCSSTTP